MLYNEKAIRLALKKYNPDLYDKCAEAGVRVMLHGLAGFKVQSTATALTPVDETMAEFYALLAESRKQTEALFAKAAYWQNKTNQTVEEHSDRLESHDARLDRIESEQSRWFSPDGDYMSIKGFWRFKGYRLATKDAAKIGSQMTRYCKAKNIKVEPVKDVQFGYVNAYPENILNEFFEQWRNS